MLKWIGVSATILIAGLGAWFGFLTVREWRRPVDVRLAITSWPASRLAYAVRARGDFTDQGLKVSILDAGENYGGAVAAVQQGQVDGGIFGLSDPLRLTASGTPMKVVGAVDYSAGADGIVADARRPTLADLKGARVAVPPLGVSRFLLHEALARVSLSVEDITVVALSPADGVRSFLGGEVDAIVAYEPFFSQAAARRGSQVLFSSAETPGLVPDVIAFRESFVAAHPAAVAAFLRAWFTLTDDFRRGEATRRVILVDVAIASGTTLAATERQFGGIELLDFADNAVSFTYGQDITSLYGSGLRLSNFLEREHRLPRPVDVAAVLSPGFIRRGLRL